MTTTMMRSFAVCFLLLLVTTTTAQDLQCPFVCSNGSTCTTCEDLPSLGDVEERCRNGLRCDCPAGWSGLRCHRPYESCYVGDGVAPDDAHKCFHGGKCITGLDDIYGNSQYFCDCNNAKDATGQFYVGKHCEHQAITLCEDKVNEFCVNNNTCLEGPGKNETHFCDCGEGFDGPHCEYDKGEVPACDLECSNGGTCELGIKNYAQAVLGYNDFWHQQEEAMHCTCSEGFFGVQCEISAQKCGSHHCFNGAKCLTADDGTRTCDCTSASSHVASYAGKFCQYRSTTFCEKSAAIEGQDFCVNGGTCQTGKTAGCECPAGFDGPLCEYNTSLGEAAGSDEGCDLSCANEGVCRKGLKHSNIGNLMPDDAPAAHIDLQHCVCPQGWFGVLCDKQVELCGDGQHVCLNGATCVSTGDIDGSWSCDCDPAQTANARFAGAYCQHEASAYCTVDDMPGLGDDNMAFCVNGGTCLADASGKGHPGCQCDDAVFAGPHCEFPLSAIKDIIRDADNDNSNTTGSWEGVEIFLAAFCSVVIVLVVAVVYNVRSKRRAAALDKDMAMRDAAMANPHPTHSTVHSVMEDLGDDPVVLDFGPERDQEGTELSTVEII